MYLLNYLMNGTSGTVGDVFAGIASVLLICALIPPFVQIVKTKKTLGLEMLFLFFAACAGASFFLVGCTLVSASAVIGSFMIVSNLIAMSINTFMFVVKYENVAKAKELGMTESDYYYNVLSKDFPSEENSVETSVNKSEATSSATEQTSESSANSIIEDI